MSNYVRPTFPFLSHFPGHHNAYFESLSPVYSLYKGPHLCTSSDVCDVQQLHWSHFPGRTVNCRIRVITNIQKRSCPSQPHEGPPDALALSRAALVPGRVPILHQRPVSIRSTLNPIRTHTIAQSLVLVSSPQHRSDLKQGMIVQLLDTILVPNHMCQLRQFPERTLRRNTKYPLSSIKANHALPWHTSK